MKITVRQVSGQPYTWLCVAKTHEGKRVIGSINEFHKAAVVVYVATDYLRDCPTDISEYVSFTEAFDAIVKRFDSQ